MSRFSGAVVAILASFSWGARVALRSEASEVVMKPNNENPLFETKMLVIIPARGVSPDHYIPTGEAIQKASTRFNLWVVVPQSFRDNCKLACASVGTCAGLNRDVQKVFFAAEKLGWMGRQSTSDIWLSGHNAGGRCANRLFQGYHTEGEAAPYAGVILMGSYLNREAEYDLASYPVPVMMLNAELDGTKASAGRTATFFRDRQDLKLEQDTTKPVFLLPGLSSSSFCPGHTVSEDLKAEVSEEEALGLIGRATAAFIGVNSGVDASDIIQGFVGTTQELLNPYLKALKMENDGQGNSPFCMEAQLAVSGLDSANIRRIKINDVYENTVGEVVKCHVEDSVASDKLELSTCSHALYADEPDWSSAAEQMICKLYGATATARRLDLPPAGEVSCIEANKRSVAIAEELAAPSTLARFKKHGRGFCYEEDDAKSIGPLFVYFSSLKLKLKKDCLSVRSSTLRTDIDGDIYPGVHYCKLLSPARALDWMMTEGLK